MAAGYKPTLVKVNAHDNDKQKVKRVTTYYRYMESSFREEKKKKKEVKHANKFNLHEMYCDRSCQEYHYFDSRTKADAYLCNKCCWSTWLHIRFTGVKKEVLFKNSFSEKLRL